MIQYRTLIITLRLYSQDGFRLIDFSNISESSGSGPSSVATINTEYLVEPDGTVRLPVIGWIHITGYTIREATQMLEQKYSQYYIKPFILLQVTNRRVIVFPGSPGSAKVVPLINNNTTLLEVLAITGGITEDGRSRQIKLIRGDPNKPSVYLIDLSTISGIKEGNTIMQEGDIIYVTPSIRPIEQILVRITPAMTLLTTVLLTITVINGVKL